MVTLVAATVAEGNGNFLIFLQRNALDAGFGRFTAGLNETLVFIFKTMESYCSRRSNR